MRTVIDEVAREVATVLSRVRDEEAQRLSEAIRKARRIFVYGEGRSGFMGKAFAMRLMHGGYDVYVIGETITPSVKAGDLFVAISGSGATASIVDGAKKAKKAGAELFAVTTHRESELAAASDGLLEVPAATKHRRGHEPQTIQPLGNQFDQSLHLLLDAVVMATVEKEDTTRVHERMHQRHANTE